MFRFLNTDEFCKTKKLAEEAFGVSEDTDIYYNDCIKNNRIAVYEKDGEIISMIHLSRMIFCYGDYEILIWYALYVATKKSERRKNHFTNLMNFVIATLKREREKALFLVPKDKRIYVKFGFNATWHFDKAEKELLFADDDLNECIGLSLNDEEFHIPIEIKKANTIDDIVFYDFDEEAFCKYYDYFARRPNISADSVPVDTLIWSKKLNTQYAIIDNRAMIFKEKSKDFSYGSLPLCYEDELPYYFYFQEKYFNEILKEKFKAFLVEKEGIDILRSSGALDKYNCSEDEEIFDYIYSGDDLRILPGKKFSKKRNRIHKFDNDNKGKWIYKSLSFDDHSEINNFIDKWYSEKNVDGDGVCIGDEYSAKETLDIEIKGLKDLIMHKNVLDMLKIGGIYIDGELSALSIGSENKPSNLAVIEIEKAFDKYEGLYQMINREFLIHEYPNVKLVNREDDVGLYGLRKAKQSYYPIILERKYNITQNL